MLSRLSLEGNFFNNSFDLEITTPKMTLFSSLCGAFKDMFGCLRGTQALSAKRSVIGERGNVLFALFKSKTDHVLMIFCVFFISYKYSKN